jgi:hypothetical protein
MSEVAKMWGHRVDLPSGYWVKSGMTTMTDSAVARFDPREEKKHFDDRNGRVCEGIKTMTGCKVGLDGETEV